MSEARPLPFRSGLWSECSCGNRYDDVRSTFLEAPSFQEGGRRVSTHGLVIRFEVVMRLYQEFYRNKLRGGFG